MVEEKLASAKAAPKSANAAQQKAAKDAFLGMIYPTEDYRLYGYVCNTRAKFILLYDDLEDPPEEEVRETFRRLHVAYVEATCNPFARPGQRINSQRFTAQVRALAVKPSPQPRASPAHMRHVSM